MMKYFHKREKSSSGKTDRMAEGIWAGGKVGSRLIPAFFLYFLVQAALPWSARLLTRVLELMEAKTLPGTLLGGYLFGRLFFYAGGAAAQYLFAVSGILLAERAEAAFYVHMDGKPLEQKKACGGGGTAEKFTLIRDYAKKLPVPVMLAEELLVSVAVSGIFLLELQPGLLIPLLLPLLVWFAFSLGLTRETGKKLEKRLTDRQELHRALSRILENLESVLVFCSRSQVGSLCLKEQEAYRESDLEYQRLYSLQEMLNQIILMAGKTGFFCAVAAVGNTGAAELMTGLLLMEYLYYPVFSVGNLFRTVRELRISKKQITTEWEKTGLEQIREKFPDEKQKPAGSPGGMKNDQWLIRADHISYSYPDSGRETLKKCVCKTACQRLYRTYRPVGRRKIHPAVPASGNFKAGKWRDSVWRSF